MTLEDDPHELFKSETASLHFADMSLVYLCLALLTPFTLSPSIDLFHGFRILQTLLMGQHVLLSPNANRKLRALLQGTFLHRMFRFSSLEQLISLIQSFHAEQAV